MKKIILLIVIVCSGILKLAAQDPCNDSSKHDTTLSAAVKYIFLYTQEYEHEKFATNFGGWIEISKSRLPKCEIMKANKEKHCGLMIYFLLDETNKFSAAFEIIENLDPAKPLPTCQSGGQIDICDRTEVFTTEEIKNSTTLKEKIEKTQNVLLTSYPRDITCSNMLEKNVQFKKQLNTYHADIVHAVGFFHTKQICELLDRSEGLRLYWGYDSANNYPLRIVVFGVDSKGKNIIDEKYILEQSWPPSEAK